MVGGLASGGVEELIDVTQGRSFDPDAIIVDALGSGVSKMVGGAFPVGEELLLRKFPIGGQAFTEVSRETTIIQQATETTVDFGVDVIKDSYQSRR